MSYNPQDPRFRWEKPSSAATRGQTGRQSNGRQQTYARGQSNAGAGRQQRATASSSQRTPGRSPRGRRPLPRRVWIGRIVSLVIVLVALFILGRFIMSWMNNVEPEVEVEIETTSAPLDPEPKTPELSFSGFEAGNIISDEVFYNSEAMSAQQVADFISEVNDGCREGYDGASCLSTFVEDSPSFPADDFCFAFEGANGDSAASIISKAATACGINPQVLMTMLQKEQGLLTASGFRLTQTRYNIAMGYGCPDSANCDEQYFGFARQVYHAARQLRMYANQPEKYQVQPFLVNDVLYSPNSNCADSQVYIENYATAALYNYTPYQPDQEALDGLTGNCSSFGNLNFYAYFNAWFG